jgi:pimeloyl-ACP methyl ester carboxylesterase
VWKVSSFAKGAWGPVEIAELPAGTPPSSEAALFQARTLLQNEYSHLLEFLEGEASNSVEPGGASTARNAIELWSKAAQEQSREFDWAGAGKIEALDEALAYFPDFNPSANERRIPTTLAWHDRTGVIIPISVDAEELLIEYVPDREDDNRAERLQYRHATSDHVLETIFDWRGYFGTASVVVDGWNKMRRAGKKFVVSVRAKFGFLVGKSLNRLSRPQPTLDRDPLFAHRLASATSAHPQVANGVPDLGRISTVKHDAAIVFVHGTVSCGIQNLKDLFPDHLRIPTYRFEHDTFRPVAENGSQLAKLIASCINTKQLILVGHSRGGLVARVALTKLRRQPYSAAMTLHTFGTPHLGTPLVQIGTKLLNQIFKLGGDVVGALPALTPLSLAYSYLLDAPALPPGIEVMQYNGQALSLLNETGDPQGVECWASQFDINAGTSGFGIEVENILLGALSGVSHDLVVPTNSALFFGTARPTLNCSHIQYFQQAPVQAFFDSLGTATTPTQSPTPPPQNAPTPVMELQKDITVNSPIEFDYIMRDGVKIPVRRKLADSF